MSITCNRLDRHWRQPLLDNSIIGWWDQCCHCVCRRLWYDVANWMNLNCAVLWLLNDFRSYGGRLNWRDSDWVPHQHRLCAADWHVGGRNVHFKGLDKKFDSDWFDTDGKFPLVTGKIVLKCSKYVVLECTIHFLPKSTGFQWHMQLKAMSSLLCKSQGKWMLERHLSSIPLWFETPFPSRVTKDS